MYRFDEKVCIVLSMRWHSQVILNSTCVLKAAYGRLCPGLSLSLHTVAFLLRKCMEKLNLFRAGRRTPELGPFGLYFYNSTVHVIVHSLQTYR